MTENKVVVDERPYQIIVGTSLLFLVDRVNNFVERGYRPIGSIGRYGNDNFYQAVYKGVGE